MSNRIQKLSPLIINQIAAGEVVTRPASVVKELLENAIDAHATHIRIDIEQGGLGLIQISDNGHGIHPNDMTLAVTRHATSKLADVGELIGIDSLGFRGEALASICAVSHLTLTSSHDETGIGQQLSLSGDEVSHAHIRPIVKNRGTTVTVRDLYYNVPARRGHLKSIATEFAHIEQVVQRLAISFADIAIELYHQDKLRFSLSKPIQNNDKKQSLNRLEQALNLPLSHIAEPFYLSLQALQQSSETIAQINGWLFVDKSNNLPKLIYINQRLVTDLAISQMMSKVTRQLGFGQDNQLQLGYALFFELPNDWINVNIHPSKQQVKIQPLTNILTWLNQKVYEQLQPKIATLVQQTIIKEKKNSTKIGKNIDDNPQDSNQSCTINKTLNVSNQVAENHLPYQLTTQETFEKEITNNQPNILSICQNDTQYFAIILLKDDFYLLNLTQLTLPIEKIKLQHVINEQLDILDNAIRISQAELLQWMLSFAS